MPPRRRNFIVQSSSSDDVQIPWSPSPDREAQSVPATKRKRNTRKTAGDEEDEVPKKRKRTARKSLADEEDGDLTEKAAKKPKRNSRKRLEPDQEELDLIAAEKKKSKYRIHEPDRVTALEEIYLTQLPQEESPPWKIRGPLWQKQKPKPPPPPIFRKSPPPKPPIPTVGRPEIQSLPARSLKEPLNPVAFRRFPSELSDKAAEFSNCHKLPQKAPHSIDRSPFFHSSPVSAPRDDGVSIASKKSPQNSPSNPNPTQEKLRTFPTPLVDIVDTDEDDFEDDILLSSFVTQNKPVNGNTTKVIEDDFEEEIVFSPLPVMRDKLANIASVGNVSSAGGEAANKNERPVPEDMMAIVDEGDPYVEHVVSSPPVAHRDPISTRTTANILPPHDNEGYDIEKDLADLPSDAFLSSMSSSPQEPLQKDLDNVVHISSQDNATTARPHALAAPLTGLRQTTLFGRGTAPVPPSQANKRHNWPLANKEEPPTHHKLDLEAMKTWVYPTNLGVIRDYQFNIVQRGLFHNLLVALPTGLGKTFVAATVMLNWLRWTKESQIVFLAPTRPLVEQQVGACLGIAGIPRRETVMMTGGIPPATRADQWESKRVFFMTPQTIVNDLKNGSCDPKKIVLLVVDEAHRATGSYSYVEVVKAIRRFNSSFRVLALTATPGGDVETVQKVIDGLEISRVEIRTENSLDIQPFIHQRSIETKVFRENKDMLVCLDLFSRAVQPVLDKLNQQNAYWSKIPTKINNYGLNQSRTKWFQSDAGRNAPQAVKGMVVSLFSALQGLCQGLDLLKYHSIRPFYDTLKEYKQEATTKWKREIANSPHFEKLMDTLQHWTADPDYVGHPKLEALREVILNHFLDAGEGGAQQGESTSATRVMVFAQWRASAEEIVRVLKLNQPMIRPHVFIGQAVSKKSEGMDQKRQKEVVEQFKAGVYNTLVATSIGEEGLDIGEVDLIVCYDQGASPIRMLQRMGRTGRKRQGRIVQLHMEGKEQMDSDKSWDAYRKMQEKIASGKEFRFHDDLARRIVPKDIQPVVDKRFIEIPIENTQAELPEPKKVGKTTKRPPKKFHMPDGVRTGFTSALRINDDDEENEGRPYGKRKPRKAAPVDEPVPKASMEEVSLSSQQQKLLQRLYQNIHDADDDKEIAPPTLTLHPERQRHKSRTRYIADHGRLTKAFISTAVRMHDMDQARINDFKKKLHMSDIEDGDSADEVSEIDEDDFEEAESLGPTPARSRLRFDMVGEAPESSPPATDPRMRIRSQAITLGTSDTEGADEAEDDYLDSELADFIVDDEEPIREPTSSLPSIQYSSKRPSRLSREQHVESDDDEELPDIGTLVQKKKKTATPAPMVAESDGEDALSEDEGLVIRQQKRRRVVVDDSEDE